MAMNHRELAGWTARVAPSLEGCFVDRVVIPIRSRFPTGYLKGEWLIRLASRGEVSQLVFGVRPRHPLVSWSPGKGPKASEAATHSPFDLSLGKLLKGARLLKVEAFDRDRILGLWFTAEGAPESVERLGLIILLIPATPEALLVRAKCENGDPRASAASGWEIVASTRSRTGVYVPPDGSRAPPEVPMRPEAARPDAWQEYVERCLDAEAFGLRLAQAERLLRERRKQAVARAEQSRDAAAQAEREPDWSRYGDLMKSLLGQAAPVQTDGKQTFRVAQDFETGEPVRLPADAQLNESQQLEKFFSLARRKKRRLEEARSRAASFEEAALRAAQALSAPPEFPDWAALERWEQAAGLEKVGEATSAAPKGATKKAGKAISGWLGRSFRSSDGATILVGRSRDENLELTFKVARGNDLWMHVKGRPGAHVLVPLSPGKSASLETLLDAAQLCLHYSDGAKWGKTEVDYTFKKHVKRIRDSTEASYVGNKTLIVAPEPGRLKRLLDQHGSGDTRPHGAR